MYDPPGEIQYTGSSYEQSYLSQDSFYGHLFVKHKLNISLKVNINNHSLKGSVMEKKKKKTRAILPPLEKSGLLGRVERMADHSLPLARPYTPSISLMGC